MSNKLKSFCKESTEYESPALANTPIQSPIHKFISS